MNLSAPAAPAASILAVGSELLGTRRLDTNSLFLTERLEALGIHVVRKACVGDGWDDLVAELATALVRAPLLVVTGGLGPTEDDRTKEAVAHFFGRRLVRDEGALEALRTRFAKRGFAMAKVNEKQADLVEGAVVLRNRRGSAPGYLVEEQGRVVVLLPGVPTEMKGMWDDEAAPHVARLFPSAAGIVRRTLKVGGMAESAVEQLVLPVYAAHPGIPVTILAHAGEIQLQFAAAGTPGEAAKLLDSVEADFRALLGERIFGTDEETLEGVVGSLLRARGATVALAESCTGGGLAERLTEVAGSSDYFLGAAVTYANAAKVDLAGVDPATLERFGAVSEETAREMARGARLRFGATIGVGVTGIAGPSGGTPEKPVGTVHVALDAADGTMRHQRLVAPGDRSLVRRWTTTVALSLLRLHLVAPVEPVGSAGSAGSAEPVEPAEPVERAGQEPGGAP